MGGLLDEATRVRAPIEGRVAVISVTTTATRWTIPEAMAGKFASFTTVTANADVNFGTSAVTCTYGQVSTMSAPSFTLVSASGGHLTANVPRWWMVPTAAEATHFSIDADQAGLLYIELATP